jgi:hypothetical protein
MLFKKSNYLALAFIYFAMGLALYACAKENLRIMTVHQKLPVSTTKTHKLSTALNLSDTTYVCILGPYSSKVKVTSKLDEEVNSYLNSLNFLGDEDHWTILYGSDSKWKIERPARQLLELMPLKDLEEKKIDTLCDHANHLLLIKLASTQIIFKTGEKK